MIRCAQLVGCVAVASARSDSPGADDGVCGGDDEDAVVFAPDDLGPALLTAVDVGTDWTETRRKVLDIRAEGDAGGRPGDVVPGG